MAEIRSDQKRRVAQFLVATRRTSRSLERENRMEA